MPDNNLPRIGDSVAAHPGTGAFLSGFRCGTVVKVGRKWVHVEMATYRGGRVITRTLRFAPSRLHDGHHNYYGSEA